MIMNYNLLVLFIMKYYNEINEWVLHCTDYGIKY